MSDKTFVVVWLASQWLAFFLLAPASAYLFFSDVHGLPTSGFYVVTLTILAVVTAGYVKARSALSSWQEVAA